MRFTHWLIGAAISAGLIGAGAHSAQPETPIYKDPRQPVQARVDDLLVRMTLDEKVAQLETVWEQKAKLQTANGTFSPALASKNFPNGIGGFARPSDYRGVTRSNGAAGASGETVNRDARQTAEYVNAAQHWAVEHTRLGIPILMHEESLHGYCRARGDQLPAGDRARKHLGPRSRQPTVLRRGTRGARPRSDARPRPCRGRCPRSALGPD